MKWDYKGVFPTGTEENAAVFYGYHGVVSYCGNPLPVGSITPTTASCTTLDGVTLEAIAVNTLGYQWQELISDTWTNIMGENTDKLSLFYHHKEGVAGVHEYRCRCIGLLDSVYTNPVSVTVTYRTPTVTARITETTLTPAGTLKLICDSREYADSIQWQELDNTMWIDIEGATTDVFEISFSHGDPAELHTYRAKVSGLGGTAYSENLTCNVTYPTPIVTASADVTSVLPPASAILTAEYTNADNGIRWQEQIEGKWTDIAGETADTLTVSFEYGTPLAYHYYRCVASGYGGVTVSGTVTIGVTYYPPEVNVSSSFSVENETATLTAITQHADNGIQWQHRVNDLWENITGETEATYTINLLDGTPAGTYYYRCQASGYGGKTASNIIAVTISYTAPEVAIRSSVTTVTAPNSVTLSVTSDKHVHVGFQWQHSEDKSTWTDIAGETGKSMSVSYTADDIGTHYYHCIGTGYGGTTQSNIVEITVN